MFGRVRAKIREDRELARERELKPASGIERRLDRLQRAFDTELQSNISINLRGTALAIGSALAILLVAQFSAVWLDDNSWEFPGIWDTVQRVLLVVSLVALVVNLIVAVWVVWPRRRWGKDMAERIEYLNKGSARKEAVALLRMLESQRALNERKGRRLRWGSIPLVIAVAAVVGQASFFAWKASPIDRGGCISEEGDAEKPANAGLPPLADQEALALQYAPRVYIHPREPSDPGNPSIPVYYEVRGSADAFRITYWFFYGFSQPNLPTASLAIASHEGDWESIDVKLAREAGAYV